MQGFGRYWVVPKPGYGLLDDSFTNPLKLLILTENRTMKQAKSMVPSQCALGEGPIWDDQRQRIFWVDILGKTVHWSDQNGEEYHSFETPDYVSNIFLTAKGEDVILSLPDGFYLWNPDTGTLQQWTQFPEYDPEIRTNDGFCDVYGNLWIGTMALSEEPELGKLYLLDGDMNWHVMLDRTSISNGIRCTPDGKSYYYIDTPTQKLQEYRFDPKGITWEWTRNVIEFSPEQGHPDGMSMDEFGRLWVSMWNGYAVLCVDPGRGEIVDRIEVAAPQVSANIFGGKQADQLFITTARKLLPNEKLQEYPLTGNLFQYAMDVKGGATYRRKL